MVVLRINSEIYNFTVKKILTLQTHMPSLGLELFVVFNYEEFC